MNLLIIVLWNYLVIQLIFLSFGFYIFFFPPAIFFFFFFFFFLFLGTNRDGLLYPYTLDHLEKPYRVLKFSTKEPECVFVQLLPLYGVKTRSHPLVGQT